VGPLVALDGISRDYGADPPVHALRSVDLHVEAGEWLTIVGPSGSGKTTLLNVVGCLDRQSSGTYAFAGIDVGSLDDGQRAGLRSRSIRFVFQSFHLLAHRSVLENVMLAEVYAAVPDRGRQERAMEALEKVGLAHRADFLPTRLSGGERQRAAVARALMGSPRLLLCDEPTGNLDSANSGAILDLFAALHAAGLTIVMITHDLAVAARAARRVHIVDGRLSESA
jgi:ABC-type lipoprotein export system ATPase subunit